jgi:ribosomal protein S18 acetylase RimI-like enzyme
MNIEIQLADYSNEQQGRDIGYLMNCYAQDPMGGGQPLSQVVQKKLASELANIPHAFSVICYVEGQPAGLINCFEGFSTFKCKPLVNIHDIIVVDAYRGQGICQMMMAQVESLAKERGCCKITLEVLEGNQAAQKSYRKFGFEGYELDPEMGKALFWQKIISAE